MAGRILWVAGAYLAGTLPSTLLVARLRWSRGGRGLVGEVRRGVGELDPHVLMTRHLGPRWAAAAAAMDVGKAVVVVAAARGIGGVPPGWLAGCGVAVVLGHTFPFYAARMAGRGLAAGAGVYLVLLPWEMVAAGAMILLGLALRNSGIATTIAMASVPAVAAWQGQPAAYVAMSAAILVVILARRLEGVGAVIRSGVSPARAIAARCLLDATAAPRTIAGPEGRAAPPSAT